jgi:Zn-dependent protease/predicted transcriptional regulator
MPQRFPNLSTVQYWVMGSAAAVVLFVSVFLHELMHSVVALGYGIHVRQIILFIFGGVSDIAEEPRDFRKEFWIAIAGPVISFVIAAALGAGWWAISQIQSMPSESLSQVSQVIGGVLLYGAIINTLLGGFNLIPAFPLDRGRILRAALMKTRRNYDDATKIAARVGIAISYGFMGIGFLAMISGSFLSGIWILLIGWFLNSGAQSYLSQHEITSLLSHLRLYDIMNTKVITISSNMSVQEMLTDYFSRYMKSAFPVVGPNDGRLRGMVTLRQATEAPEDKRQLMRAEDIMTPINELAVMQPDRRADEALMKMMRIRSGGKVFVCDQQGRLLGIVSKTDIINIASERQDYQKELERSSSKGSFLSDRRKLPTDTA